MTDYVVHKYVIHTMASIKFNNFGVCVFQKDSWCVNDFLSTTCYSVFLHYLGFACYFPFSIFLLWNNFFLFIKYFVLLYPIDVVSAHSLRIIANLFDPILSQLNVF